VSPSSPPTANATITDKLLGSIFGGHSAKRKFGGPEIYSVARIALTAGLPGNSVAKMRLVSVEVAGLVASL